MTNQKVTEIIQITQARGLNWGSLTLYSVTLSEEIESKGKKKKICQEHPFSKAYLGTGVWESFTLSKITESDPKKETQEHIIINKILHSYIL